MYLLSANVPTHRLAHVPFPPAGWRGNDASMITQPADVLKTTCSFTQKSMGLLNVARFLYERDWMHWFLEGYHSATIIIPNSDGCMAWPVYERLQNLWDGVTTL
ncbi:hypothetical protein MAR_029389 [Mya arenaria]|uniref:Uncharacterized protein n=1 Tax=Mya arenaria TaxID=6604 RepID=A0ABY7DHB4_MYAAR|nr:hypothetical protein MAR_029389 [Mya arenaria]